VRVFSSYRDVLAPGSYLALTHVTDDFAKVKGDELTEMMKKSQNSVQPRAKADILRFFGDFELLEPGLVTTSQWRPEQAAAPGDNPEDDGLYAGVAFKK
jgi:hypothetical protein